MCDGRERWVERFNRKKENARKTRNKEERDKFCLMAKKELINIHV